ncbi:MAG TPA: diguanylate cyclase, partial [Anaerolineales bacterium]|nr:diguanylate cyclase [Anaerolineales bacterium]
MKDSVIVLNSEKRVLYVNHVTEKLFNLTEDRVIGQPFNHVAGHLANLLIPYLKQSGPHNEIQIQEGKEEKTYEVSISPITGTNQNTSDIVITLHDITLRKEKEQELSRHGLIMSAISKAAEQFLKTDNWEQHIVSVLENLGQAADVSKVVVTIEHTHNTKYEWKAQDWGNVSNPISQLTIPVIVNGEPWASISFDENRRERQWTNMELEAFQTAANILAAAETRTQTVHQLNRRQLALGLLQDIATVSLQAANLNEMAEVSAERLAKLIKADGCYLTLWNDVTKHVVPVAAYGTGKETYARTSAKEDEKTFTQSSLELEKTLIVEDVYNTPYASPSVVSRFPAKSLLILPLIALDQKLGAVLVSFETPHQFTDEEVQICEQAASLIALALEKFQAMDEARKRADTAENLRKVGLAVAEQTELKQAVNYVLEQLKQMVPYDSASVQLREGDELYIIGGQGWGDEQEVIDLRFHIPGDNPNTIVIERGSPYYLPDAGEVYQQFRKPPHNHIRSWLGIPLLVQEKVIGLLAIDSAEPNDFSEQEIMIATEFANQVAVTLENARILKETQTQAVTDPLTGISNRRGLIEAGKTEFAKTKNTNRPFSAIMLDLDYFKSINDTYGHAVGDLVLREFAKRCKSCIREIDYIGRYGGEEFIILLPDAHMKASMN